MMPPQPFDWTASNSDLRNSQFQPAVPTMCQSCWTNWRGTARANLEALQAWASGLQSRHDGELFSLGQQREAEVAGFQTEIEQLKSRCATLQAENYRLSQSHDPALSERYTALQQENRLLAGRAKELEQKNASL